MGCDMHWAIERRHRDGSWHTVLTETYFISFLRNGRGWDHPVHELDSRSYFRFALFSHVRNEWGDYCPASRLAGVAG